MATILDPAKEGFKKFKPKNSTVLAKQVTESVQVNTPDGTADAHPGDYIVVVSDREIVTSAIPKDRASGRPEIPATKTRVPVVEVMTQREFESLYEA